MPNGFAVQPDKLEAFRTEVKTIVDNYETIVGQVKEARLRTADSRPESPMDALLGTPERLGPSGPPVEFTNASRTMLENYDSLLETLGAVHAAIQEQFTYMQVALGHTLEVYTRIDTGHAGAFQRLLGDSSPEGS